MVNTMSKVGSVTRRTRRLGVLCALVGAMVTTLGAQELREVLVLKSGLLAVRGGSTRVLTVAEVGATASTSEVSILFLDAADQRRGSASGILMRGKPVRARVRVQGDEQLRVVVRVLQLADPAFSQPIVTLEDLDVDSLRIETKPPCAPPPSIGGGAEGNCDGWGVTRFAANQAGNSGLD